MDVKIYRSSRQRKDLAYNMIIIFSAVIQSQGQVRPHRGTISLRRSIPHRISYTAISHTGSHTLPFHTGSHTGGPSHTGDFLFACRSHTLPSHTGSHTGGPSHTGDFLFVCRPTPANRNGRSARSKFSA